MSNTVRQSVVLPAPAPQLYQMYLDPEQHAAFTGQPVQISSEPASPFRAFDGLLTGKMIATIEPSLIVQVWRSVSFGQDDPDSTLILSFTSAGEHGRIDLIHVNVPDGDLDGVTQGWNKFYWTPWRNYLEQRPQAS